MATAQRLFCPFWVNEQQSRTLLQKLVFGAGAKKSFPLHSFLRSMDSTCPPLLMTLNDPLCSLVQNSSAVHWEVAVAQPPSITGFLFLV